MSSMFYGYKCVDYQIRTFSCVRALCCGQYFWYFPPHASEMVERVFIFFLKGGCVDCLANSSLDARWMKIGNEWGGKEQEGDGPSPYSFPSGGRFSVWERKENAEVAPRKMPYFKTREHRQSGTAHSRNDPEASAGPTAVVTCCLFLQFYCAKRMVGNTLTSIKLHYT